MRSEVVLHLRGRVLVSADDDESVGEAWVVGGRVTFERPVAADTDITEVQGWVVPGLVDAHNHIGLGPGGAIDADAARVQALTDLAAGAMLIRDCCLLYTSPSPRD